MQTTWQRLAPEGTRWAPKFQKGSKDGNMSNMVVQMILLDRAVTMYWENRPTAPGMSVLQGSVAV